MISATGPSRSRTGSSMPQVLCFAWLVGTGAATGAGASSKMLALERFLPLPPFPGIRDGAALATTAVRSAVVREVAYDS